MNEYEKRVAFCAFRKDKANSSCNTKKNAFTRKYDLSCCLKYKDTLRNEIIIDKVVNAWMFCNVND